MSTAKLADLTRQIKSKIPFDTLFREYYPDNQHSNGVAICPWHDDRNPSLSLRTEGGHCHGACANGEKPKRYDIFDLYKKRHGVDFKAARAALAERCGIVTEPEPKSKSRVVEEYLYRDEDGHALFKVQRKEPKSFVQCKPEGDETWTYKLGNVRRTLYHLPELLESDSGQPVLFVEGERDCHSAEALGFIATTVPGGANQWPGLVKNHRIHEPLKDRSVWIIPDNDAPGKAFANAVAATLAALAKEVKLLILPGLEEKQDLSDFVSLHGPHEAKRLLLEIAAQASEYEPAEDDPKIEARARVRAANFTDMGNAQRLASLFGDRIHHCKHLGWLVYDGRRWVADDESQIQGFAKETVREMYLRAAQEPDEERRKTLISFALKCESASRIAAMIQLLPSERGISVSHELFDRDKMLLNTVSGTIDLRSGHIRLHSPDDLITKLAPVEYDPDAKCERWERFVSEIMDGDPELVSFLKRFLGYTLTGDTKEQVWGFLWGKGENGKGTLLATVAHVLGDYSVNTPAETFMEVSSSGIRNDLARLRGARLVTASEPKGNKFDPAVLKSFTGQDPITARFLHKEFFEYMPEAKLFFCANQRPAIWDTSHGFWRRVLLIPFTRVFGAGEKDDGLREQLKAEGSGILNWMLQGCLDWQATGLGTPQAVRSAVDDYRSETDILAEFLEIRCIIEPGRTAAVKDLYASYRDYAEEKHIKKPLSKQKFNEDLLGRPTITRTKVGPPERRIPTWVGIGLKPRQEDPDGRSCGACDHNGEPCPKGKEGRDAATCQYYARYN